MNEEQRGPWYLLTGLVIGLVLGVIVAWKIAPVEYVDTSPGMLSEEYKAQCRLLIAEAFVADGNLPRAQKRLELLEDEETLEKLTLQARDAQEDGSPESQAKALSLLVVAINQGNTTGISLPAFNTDTPTPPAPTATMTPSPSFTPSRTSTSVVRTAGPSLTPLPSRTATPTSGAPYVIEGEPEPLCLPEIEQPLLVIEVYDAAGQQVPGVEIIITWDGGEEHIFTGLKPERGLGYADFLMEPGVEYTISTMGGGETITGLTARECTTSSGSEYWGAWTIRYVQP